MLVPKAREAGRGAAGVSQNEAGGDLVDHERIVAVNEQVELSPDHRLQPTLSAVDRLERLATPVANVRGHEAEYRPRTAGVHRGPDRFLRRNTVRATFMGALAAEGLSLEGCPAPAQAPQGGPPGPPRHGPRPCSGVAGGIGLAPLEAGRAAAVGEASL